MGHVRRIGPVTQIPFGEGRVFEVGAVRMAIFRTRAGEVFATQAECPHRGGPLADGLLDTASIVCPLHDRAFDLRTGQGPDCKIVTYPVHVQDGEIVLLENS
jgi:nitrite reductase (NADH) small subunit